MEPGTPLGSTVDDDGVSHTVERVDDPERCAAIGAAVAGHAVLIADGHHRYGVSRQYREECRAANGGRPGSVRPHHGLRGGAGRGAAQRGAHPPPARRPAGRAGLARGPGRRGSITEPAGPATPELAASLVELDALAFVEADGTATLLRPRADRFDGVRDLDSARLEHALADVPHVLRYEPGLASVIAALAAGEAQAAVLVRPVSVAEIERTASEGALMPPKSTFFTPKLRTGLVLRSLD